MSVIPLFKNITTFCIFILLLIFVVPSIGQTSVAVQDCTPEITGLQNETYLPLDALDQEIIHLSVSGIGFSVGTFQGSGADRLTRVTGGGAQIDTRRLPAGEYELYFVLDKYAHEGCELGAKSAPLTFYADGDIAEEETNIPRAYTGRVGDNVVLQPVPSPLTYSVPEFRYSIDPDRTTARAARVTKDGCVTAASAGKIVVVVTEINLLSASLPASVTVTMQ